MPLFVKLISHPIIFGACLLATINCNADVADVTPNAACNYLATIGLRTTTYRQQADGSFRCITPHIDIGTIAGTNGALNNIVYYAVGQEQAIDSLQLVISVNNPNEATAIHRRLKDVANALAKKLSAVLPAAIEQSIAVGSNANSVIDKRAVAVVRTNRSADNGYEVKVIFK
jgi:hypothetical protein